VATIYGISNLLNIGEGFPEQIQQVHRSAAVTEALLVHGAAFRTFAGATIDSDPKKRLPQALWAILPAMNRRF
jgi:hypothetical protein